MIRYKLIVVLLFTLSVPSAMNASHVISPRSLNSQKDSFDIKGFHLDLRIQVIKPKALHQFASQLVNFGINTLIMEWEASYPYEKHAVISNELSYSKEEVDAFITYCTRIGLNVIPLQQCFGHVEYILRHDRYREIEEDHTQISQLCPMEFELNKALFTDLFSDMAANHNSDYIHIGGDETYLLGQCDTCSKTVNEKGESKLFVDHMKLMCDIVIDLGKTPIMWSDMITKYPDAVDSLPKETVFIDWNYGVEISSKDELKKLIQKGYQVWGSPAIRSGPDNWYLTDWQKHFKNQQDFIPYAQNAGYKGIVVTSWSTSGQYGYTWDEYYKLIDMEQIRNVYPLSGFRILLAYYAHVLNNTSFQVPQQFVENYGVQRFGLSTKHATMLWQSLSQTQNIVYNETELKNEQVNSNLAVKILSQIEAKTNLIEFDHLVLMADLRAHYLKVMQVDLYYNSENYTSDNAKEILPQIKQLIDNSKVLDERYLELNNDFLYQSEITNQSNVRNKALLTLYNRTAKVK